MQCKHDGENEIAVFNKTRNADLRESRDNDTSRKQIPKWNGSTHHIADNPQPNLLLSSRHMFPSQVAGCSSDAREIHKSSHPRTNPHLE
jgi:hypothetical protein